jgi:hypothetical protein
MLRLLVAALLVSIGGLAFAAGPHLSKCVDLSDASAMTKILDSNPVHYEKIQNIVFGLANRPYGEVRRWLRTNYQVRDVSISQFILTTSPGQRDLSFVLDDTRYYGRVISMQRGGTAFLIRNR